jgi:hypothetical protein
MLRSGKKILFSVGFGRSSVFNRRAVGNGVDALRKARNNREFIVDKTANQSPRSSADSAEGVPVPTTATPRLSARSHQPWK